MHPVHASIITLALLGFALAIVLSSGAQARDDVPENIASQFNPVTELTPRDVRYYQKQFKAKCARCHGLDGSGDGDDANEQEVPPADFTDTAFMKSRTDGQLYYQILMGGGERRAMPAFGPESDQGWSKNKIWYMVAFIRRFSQPPAE
jgi:mono/diheme cytochrome c family protein